MANAMSGNQLGQADWLKSWQKTHPGAAPKEGWRGRVNQSQTTNQSGQWDWLSGWQQRQQNNPNWDSSWVPKDGWRGRVNQSQTPGMSAPLPPPTPHPPVQASDPIFDGYQPPPPPPVYGPAGFRTLAPVGVADGGWGGGALEHTPGQLITPPAPPPPPPAPAAAPQQFPSREPNVPAYGPGESPPTPWAPTGRAGQDQWLKGWQQRQRNAHPDKYNASWMPKEGWRGRFNQGGTNAMREY